MHPLRAPFALFLLLAALPLAAREPVLTPQSGVALLRNGNVIQGEVTRAGDYYIITLGTSGEVRLAAADVDTICVDLDDAYRYKLATVRGAGAPPHLDLAEWCLRQGLISQAGEQLVTAMRKEPSHARLAAVERKLKLALESARQEPVRQPTKTPAAAMEEMDQAVDALPPGTLERFSAMVHPILLNRCATGGCHGPSAPSDFRLLRPAAGQAPSQRITRRNLHAVLQQLDKDDPDASPLLKVPQQPHGKTAGPLFDKRTQQQLDELTAWTRLALAVPTARPAAATVQAQGTPSQRPIPAVRRAVAEEEVESPPGAADQAAPRGAPRPFAPPKDAAPLQSKATAATTPRDPFDPEVFNRQFRGK